MKYKLLKDLPMTKAGAIFQEMNSAEDAKKSIKEHEADWRKYFGIKEGN